MSIEKPNLIDGKEWFLTVTRNMSFWHQESANVGHYSHLKDFGVDAKLEILEITVNGTETSVFMAQPNYGQYTNAVLEAINTKNKISNLKERYNVLGKKLLSSLEKCRKNLSIKNWEAFIKDYQIMSAGLMITATIGRQGADLLMQKLKEKGFNEEEIPQIVGSVTYPSEHTPLFKSQIDMLKIGIKIQQKNISKKETYSLIEKWLKNYKNIPVNWCEEPWTEKDAKAQLDNFLKKDCKKELEISNKEHDNKAKKAKELLKKINDKEISLLAEAIAEGTYLNEFRKNIFSKVSLDYRPIFQKIAEMSDSKNWRDCFYLTPTEMTRILKGEKISIKNLVANREIVGMYSNEKSSSNFLDKDTLRNLINYMKSVKKPESNDSKEEIIRGHSASRGKVTGTVKVILSSKDFHKLNNGDILVTTMTSVDFVPIMAKAAAFVTNEGGITSHASIVAREMNKPCIIGTRIATKVLKDGDIVEVDAEKGIVRIIK
ncbi:MAG: PEP-utilizing enzyme [Nanoarchaeota archaeon]|nr:PEP-utilizing enzyme [Nanoarchaeota archaeon]